jgi:hypothetical protein
MRASQPRTPHIRWGGGAVNMVPVGLRCRADQQLR